MPLRYMLDDRQWERAEAFLESERGRLINVPKRIASACRSSSVSGSPGARRAAFHAG
jgi:hypothetical protein